MLVMNGRGILTCVLAAAVLVLAAQKGNGILLALFVPWFLLYAPYQCFRMIRRQAERRNRALRLGTWLLVLVVAGFVQSYWSTAVRRQADLVAIRVLQFKQRVGSYPASLREVGLDEQTLQTEWALSYSVRAGRPILRYPAPVMPLSTCDYDFSTRLWRLNAY